MQAKRPPFKGGRFRLWLARAFGTRRIVGKLSEREGVMISALHLAARHRAAARYVHHAADHRAGRAVQAMTRDRHRRAGLPSVGLGIVDLVGAEHLAGGFAAKNPDLAAEQNA